MGFIAKIKNAFEEKLVNYVNQKSFEKLWSIRKEYLLFNNGVSNPYQQVSSVFMAIRVMADNVTQVDFKFYKDGTENEVKDPRLKRLFSNPNPMMSFSELLEATVIFHKIYGESFWLIESSLGQQAGTNAAPAEIWTYSPTKFSEITENGMLTGWRYGTNRLSMDQVVHFRDFNPNNEYRGLSSLKPLEQVIDIDWLSLCYNKVFFQNDATPGFMLSTDKSLSEVQRNRLTEWIEKRHKGASNAFKTAVLEAGLKPVTVGADHQKMQFLETRRYNREEVLGVFRVPKALFSITDDLNYATFMGQKKVFWTDTIMPIMRRIESEINSQFMNKFFPGVVIRFDYSNVLALQEDLKEKLDMAHKYKDLGYPLNMINKRLNLGMEEVAWGDVAWLPAGTVPISSDENPLLSLQDLSDEDEEKSFSFKDLDDKKSIEYSQKFFIAKQTRLEMRMEGKIGKFFLDQKKRLLDTINQKGISKDINVSFNWDKESDDFANLMKPFIRDGISAGVAAGKNQIGVNVENENLFETRLTSYLALRTQASKTIIDRWGKSITNLINQSISQGDSINTLSEKISRQYNVIGNKAKMIARTESTGAINGGTVEYYDEIGVEKKVWLTAGDEVVRESHQELHGMSVGVKQKFPNGLDYPGGEGPAEEVINCRCSMYGKLI